MVKKILIALMLSASVITLVGCGENESSSNISTTQTEQNETDVSEETDVSQNKGENTNKEDKNEISAQEDILVNPDVADEKVYINTDMKPDDITIKYTKTPNTQKDEYKIQVLSDDANKVWYCIYCNQWVGANYNCDNLHPYLHTQIDCYCDCGEKVEGMENCITCGKTPTSKNVYYSPNRIPYAYNIYWECDTDYCNYYKVFASKCHGCSESAEGKVFFACSECGAGMSVKAEQAMLPKDNTIPNKCEYCGSKMLMAFPLELLNGGNVEQSNKNDTWECVCGYSRASGDMCLVCGADKDGWRICDCGERVNGVLCDKCTYDVRDGSYLCNKCGERYNEYECPNCKEDSSRAETTSTTRIEKEPVEDSRPQDTVTDRKNIGHISTGREGGLKDTWICSECGYTLNRTSYEWCTRCEQEAQ